MTRHGKYVYTYHYFIINLKGISHIQSGTRLIQILLREESIIIFKTLIHLINFYCNSQTTNYKNGK